MKYLFIRDTIFATIAAFLIIAAFKFIPLNLHIFDPVKAAFSDIQFNDLAFSKIKKEEKFDENIIIINVDTAKRKDIARLLTTVSNCNVSVIGMDVLFLDSSTSNMADRMLGNVMNSTPNLVVAEKLIWVKGKPLVQNYYVSEAHNTGYANFIGEEKGVIRSYSPFEKDSLVVHKSFTSAIMEMADINNYHALEKRDNEIELINYKRSTENYMVFDWLDVLDNKVDAALLKNKIVLLGYIDNTGFNIADKHYTPLNKDFIHKKVPDMDGVIIHANILSMIMANQFIHKMPNWLNFLLAVFLTYLHIAIFVNYYINNHKWLHVRFIDIVAIQFLLSIIFISVGISLLRLNYYFDFTLPLYAIMLSLYVLYFYEGFTNWIKKKYNFKTIFSHSNH